MSTKRKQPARREVLPPGIARRNGVLVPVLVAPPSAPAVGKTSAASAALLELQRWKREADTVTARQEHAVVVARRAGASWSEIATALGVSTQAAHTKYRDRVE